MAMVLARAISPQYPPATHCFVTRSVSDGRARSNPNQPDSSNCWRYWALAYVTSEVRSSADGALSMFSSTTWQSEMADSCSVWSIFDVTMHFFIIMRVWRHGIIWCHIWFYLAMENNPLPNSWAQIRIPIWTILEEDQATGSVKNQVNRSNSLWVMCTDRQTNKYTNKQTQTSWDTCMLKPAKMRMIRKKSLHLKT